MIALDVGDKIRGDASAATVIDYTLHGVIGSAISQIADGQLAATETDIYEAAAIVAVASIILVNTGTSARTINLYLKPSAGTSRRLIPKNMILGAGYSLHFDGAKVSILDTNGAIVTTGSVSDEAYNEATWNGVAAIAPSKNAVRDEFENRKISTGSYTGNGTDNRAISHSLGKVPRFILIVRTSDSTIIVIQVTDISTTTWSAIWSGTTTIFTATATDATNFYVGTGGAGAWGNDNTLTFSWIAFG